MKSFSIVTISHKEKKKQKVDNSQHQQQYSATKLGSITDWLMDSSSIRHQAGYISTPLSSTLFGYLWSAGQYPSSLHLILSHWSWASSKAIMYMYIRTVQIFSLKIQLTGCKRTIINDWIIAISNKLIISTILFGWPGLNQNNRRRKSQRIKRH